jgi:exosortase E/protease (VPEID-CTERM system)
MRASAQPVNNSVAIAAPYPVGGVDRSASLLTRFAVLAIISSIEVSLYYYLSNSPVILTQAGSLGFSLDIVTRWSADIVVTGFAATIVLTWRDFIEFVSAVIRDDSDPRWRHYLWIQAGFAAAMIGLVSISPESLSSRPLVVSWAIVRVILFAGVIAASAVSIVTPALWLRWFSSNRLPFIASGSFAIVARVCFGIVQNGSGLYAMTVHGAEAMLRILGQQPILIGRDIIKVPHFSVQVEPACSGVEGIALVTVFLGVYLFFSRDELRFPRALILIPIGIASSWILNCARIATLVIIGKHNPFLAVRVFHSVAGWALFNFVGIGLVAASRAMPMFGAEGSAESQPRADEHRASAGAYLVPLLAILATAFAAHPFAPDFDWLYPLRVIAGVAALVLYRNELRRLTWSISWWPVSIGAVVFGLWIVFVRITPTASGSAMAAGLAALTAPQRIGWIAFRVAGAVITVPLAEELAFRGYLLRKLISDDFESVDPSHFTWLSFLVSSAAFGVMHGAWGAGIVAGMLFAIAMYRRGSIADAVVAHAVSNALLAAYVLLTANWALWT